jgi:hypothetical protein
LAQCNDTLTRRVLNTDKLGDGVMQKCKCRVFLLIDYNITEGKYSVSIFAAKLAFSGEPFFFFTVHNYFQFRQDYR